MANTDLPTPPCPLKFVTITAGHVSLLKEIQSPLIQLGAIYAEELDNPDSLRRRVDALQCSDEQIAEVLFIFSRSPAETRSILRKGREALTESACAVILDPLPVGDLIPLTRAAMEQWGRAFTQAQATNPQ